MQGPFTSAKKRYDRRWGAVHEGRDGWLFLTGGSNRVMDRYARGLRHWWLLRRWTRLIEARAARAARLGIRCLHVIVPEKLSVHDEFTDGLPYDPGAASTRRLAQSLAREPAYLDLLAPMRAARGGAPLYLRTDTHWTLDGCLVAYRAVMRALAAVPPPDIAARGTYAVTGVFDLGEKLARRPPETVVRGRIPRDAMRAEVGALLAASEAAGTVGELHTGAHCVYRNAAPQADPRRMVVFGDSYAHFDPILLTGLLAESFAEVHFVWSSSLDWGYIARVAPDILLFELAERFLARIPDDRYEVVTAAPADAGTGPASRRAAGAV